MKYKELINQETLRSLPQEEQDNYLKVTQRKRAELALDLSSEYVNKPFYYHKSFIIKDGKIQKRRASIKEQAQQDFELTGSFSLSSMSDACAYAWNEVVINNNGKYNVPSDGIPRYKNRTKREVFNMGKLAKIKGKNLVPYPLALARVLNDACGNDRLEGSETHQSGKRTIYTVNKYCAAQYLDDFLLVCSEFKNENFPILRKGRTKWKENNKIYHPENLFTKEQRNQVQKEDKDGQIKISDEGKLAKETPLEDRVAESKVSKPKVVEPEPEAPVMEDVMDGKYATQEYNELEERVNATVESDSIAEMRRQLDEQSRRMAKMEKEATVGGLFRKAIRATQNTLAMPFGAMERMIKAKDETGE